MFCAVPPVCRLLVDLAIRCCGRFASSLALGFDSPEQVGRTFSVEELFYPSPVCVSYALRKLPKAEREVVLNNCPEARAIAGYLPGSDWLAHPEGSPPSKCIGKMPPEPCPWP